MTSVEGCLSPSENENLEISWVTKKMELHFLMHWNKNAINLTANKLEKKLTQSKTFPWLKPFASNESIIREGKIRASGCSQSAFLRRPLRTTFVTNKNWDFLVICFSCEDSAFYNAYLSHSFSPSFFYINGLGRVNIILGERKCITQNLK